MFFLTGTLFLFILNISPLPADSLIYFLKFVNKSLRIGWGYRGRGSPLVPIQANRFTGQSEIYRQPWIKDKYKKIKWEGKLSASAGGKTTSRFQRIAWLRLDPGKAMESIFSMGKYWDKTIASWTTFCRYDNVKINRMRCTDETNKRWFDLGGLIVNLSGWKITRKSFFRSSNFAFFFSLPG